MCRLNPRVRTKFTSSFPVQQLCANVSNSLVAHCTQLQTQRNKTELDDNEYIEGKVLFQMPVVEVAGPKERPFSFIVSEL